MKQYVDDVKDVRELYDYEEEIKISDSNKINEDRESI